VPDLTLEDVAKQAGVSRSTVSRVVNDHPNVSEDVRKRVLNVIQKTGYRPHAAARTLASQHSWTIGLVLPHSVSDFFTDPYYAHLTKGIAQACNQHNFTLALFLVSTKDDEEKIFPRVSRKGLLDGVLVQSGHHGDQQIIGDLIDANMPLVVVGRPFRSDNVNYIDVDNVTASYVAVNHLIRLGYQRIGTITGPENSTVGIDRKAGYLKALTEHGYSIDRTLITEGDFTEAGGYSAMKRLLPARPDAVFAASDVMVLGAIRAVREDDLRVPEDIAFVGFDDIPASAMAEPPLTTVRQSASAMGSIAVETLIDIIDHPRSEPRCIVVATELVIRSSCGALKSKPEGGDDSKNPVDVSILTLNQSHQ